MRMPQQLLPGASARAPRPKRGFECGLLATGENALAAQACTLEAVELSSQLSFFGSTKANGSATSASETCARDGVVGNLEFRI
jgi:hypothetical protein